MAIMTIARAREIGVKLRCDHRSVLRAWREPGSIRGMLGEALEAELAPLRAADSAPAGPTPHSEAPGHERLESA